MSIFLRWNRYIVFYGKCSRFPQTQTQRSYQALWLKPSCRRLLHATPDSERMRSSCWAIRPSRAEPHLHSLDVPTRRLDKRLRRCTPGQDARQWGSRSGCSFTQGPEEHDRPGSTCHQSHRPCHRIVDVQPDSIRAPPLAHDDRDQRGRQGTLPRRSGFVRQPVWTSYGGLCGTLHGGLKVVSGNATLPPETHHIFCCFQSP